jgi:hypothetical protein
MNGGYEGLCDAEHEFLLREFREDLDLSGHLRDPVNSLRVGLAADQSIRESRIIDLKDQLDKRRCSNRPSKHLEVGVLVEDVPSSPGWRSASGRAASWQGWWGLRKLTPVGTPIRRTMLPFGTALTPGSGSLNG